MLSEENKRGLPLFFRGDEWECMLIGDERRRQCVVKPIHISEMHQSTEKWNRALVIAGMKHTPNYISGTSVTHDLRL